jgi:hypothetical protein
MVSTLLRVAILPLSGKILAKLTINQVKNKMKYTIFGGGPSGLYTAWRLIQSGRLTANDSLEIIEWGDYDYDANGQGTRLPAGRICSYHYQNNTEQSYIEVGGMRFIKWDSYKKEGHQLVTTTLSMLNLNDKVIEFNTTTDPLLFLRGKQMYQSSISPQAPAPYNTETMVTTTVDGFSVTMPANEVAADTLIGSISNSIVGDQASTRVKQCQFYAGGILPNDFESSVYKPGDLASNIGYWNVLYDQAYNEGYQYASDANGYSSNVINWNAANAAVYNGEFAPGGQFKTLKTGFSSIFVTMYQACKDLARDKGLNFTMTKNTRLHSIWDQDGVTEYLTSSAANPDQPQGAIQSTDVAFLAMPPHAIKVVAGATRYLAQQPGRSNFLNQNNVANYLESVVEQPSFKVAMFFDRPWWSQDQMPYPLKVNDATNTFGPTITDLPIRQLYYFGNNANGEGQPPVYGVLAAYDDMRFTRFWEELEWSVNEQHSTPPSRDVQPLIGAKQATPEMANMLRLQLARIHYGDDGLNNPELIPEPLETTFMNWGHDPFGAGYHAWASHYNICNVMQQIRTPETLAGLSKKPSVFVVGSAFSNDQAWIEGAFCTAESVLVDYLGVETIATDAAEYPLICGSCDI